MLTSRAIALHAGVAAIVTMLFAGCRGAETFEGSGTEQVRSAFDSGAWKSGEPGVRGRMVHDLVDGGLLVGKTRSEVKLLLGEPDQEGEGFLAYFVFFGADHAAAPAYTIQVELNQRGEVVRDAHINADRSPD